MLRIEHHEPKFTAHQTIVLGGKPFESNFELALTIQQPAQLLDALPLLPRTMAGLAMLSGVRRGELFGLRWRDLDEEAGCLRFRARP